ncbi:MAG: hypothetical protein ACLGG6_07675 [Gammaproteobacteria bacterium]
MTPHLYSNTPDIVIAATRWLIQRHRLTGCPGVARLVRQHLDWLDAHADDPELADARQRLALAWHAPIPPQAAGASPVWH